jgi:hypothetical protein
MELALIRLYFTTQFGWVDSLSLHAFKASQARIGTWCDVHCTSSKKRAIEALGSWPGHCDGKEVIKRVTLDVQVLETLPDGINDL